ncbi:hypothetical protein CDEST_10394 [Colletotrichum destructivum]|uniref:DUF7587 domain-containing protein n=1 Tax=Colletotrichum destructivum TaxID=34406 RepID=A0AAX4IQG5_9PEZI|nr:hypothetical protein CDEST_10394 [Colletotrichum destructivum]
MSNLNDVCLGTPFTPNPFNQVLVDSVNDIPKYLFRVSDTLSAGTTNRSEVCSAAAAGDRSGQPYGDLYQLPPSQAARLLDDHLWPRWSASPSNLVSWTSSLLVALQYGLFCHGRSSEPQELSKILILMVDTRQFRCKVFARDLQVLAAFQGISDELDLKTLHNWRNTGATAVHFTLESTFPKGDLPSTRRDLVKSPYKSSWTAASSTFVLD